MLSLSSLSASATVHSPHVTALDQSEWSHVVQCEEGGDWHYWSYAYPDALGITRANWVAAGGSPEKHYLENGQIRIAVRFLRSIHQAMPDQHGCTGPY